jgi:hypothetical protein
VSIELNDADIDLLMQNIDEFDASEQEEILEIAEVLAERKKSEAARNDLIEFCKVMQPDYKVGKHHRILANLLMDIAEGKKDRICVNMPPRHGKSQLVSIYFPAWFIGRYPNKKVLMVSHTTDLAVDFGRKVRNLIDSDPYRKIFPTVLLASDSKSAGRWNTNAGGEYFACGVGSALAGRGADLLLVDDPHNEQDIINGNFDIWQRGTSFTGNEYGVDRWLNFRVGSASTMSRQAFTVGQTDVPGEPQYFCRMAVTSVAGASNFARLTHKIEGVRSFAGQQITVSFWAKADASTNIAIEFGQWFGDGGSPSSFVGAIGTTKKALATSWQKITHTVTVPAIVSKTIGSALSDFLELNIWLDAGLRDFH